MRSPTRKTTSAAIAAVVAAALTAGLTSPASAANGGPGGAPAAAKAGASGPAVHTVTLITGDRVLVDARGRVVTVQRADGRAGIPVFTEVRDGRTYVVPFDARRLIADGTLDRRLFDITELTRPESLKAHRAGLKVIVGYRGAAAQAARAGVRTSEGTTVRRTLRALDADAVTSARGRTGELWDALTRSRADGSTAATSGISRIWLDGVRKATLDRSTGQIGAPAAWARSLDGTGVKIAVLDTGIDATHPDLAGRVVAAKNFSSATGPEDKHGHGTHVASTAAGRGVKDSRFKGVAPGAELINAKVLDDGGSGDDSGIVAGIDWAVAQGADVLNLSLGGYDTPEIDPLEAQINKLSAEKGVLFAVAAGNSGPDAGGIGSPGSADAALTVGAVDDNDRLAEFSSVGPRNGDGGLKPDVTAPGVATTAAAATGTTGQNPPGYTTMSGTSMATPHVAGAAAILKQKNRDWTGDRIKATLMASAVGGAYSPFQQGAGRIRVDKSLDQAVTADPASVSLGTQLWPHHDDTPVTKKITYRNSGTADVTLDLAPVSAVGGDGRPAPAGFFTLGARRITVPAGGTAAVDLTADTRLGGSVNGSYSVTVAATGGGASVRVPASVVREVESYDVTFRTTGRDGAPSTKWVADLSVVTGPDSGREYLPDLTRGTTTVRIPRGTYEMSAFAPVDPVAPEKGGDVIHSPVLSVTGPTTVALDGRATKPVTVKVPDAAARQTSVGMSYFRQMSDGGYYGRSVDFTSFADVRTGYIGPRVTDGSLSQSWYSQWVRGTTEYNTLSGGPVERLATGWSKTYAAKDFALLKTSVGASVPGKQGGFGVYGELPDNSSTFTPWSKQPLPGSRNIHVSTGDGAIWDVTVAQFGPPDPEGYPTFETIYGSGVPKRYTGGRTYTEVYNTGVQSPVVNADSRIERDVNYIYAPMTLFGDGAGHLGLIDYTTAKTTLHRNGVLHTSEPLPLDEVAFRVPSASASYTVATSVNRSPAVTSTSTRVEAWWTFTSVRTKTPAVLPVSTVRFQPPLALDSTAPAGRSQTFPVVVQGPAAGANLKSLAVWVSYDNAKTWKSVPVKSGKVTVVAPAKGKGLALKAQVVDKKNNKGSVVVHNAYRGK
ncbi:S8 family serine peptidase [Streptomyces sp. NPDC020875]|uniref:S8 family peptidase n=1 Tax=Streptomyces sp. NPDC020875 TaxID=3154898 RepID=UPI003405BB64